MTAVGNLQGRHAPVPPAAHPLCSILQCALSFHQCAHNVPDVTATHATSAPCSLAQNMLSMMPSAIGCTHALLDTSPRYCNACDPLGPMRLVFCRAWLCMMSANCSSHDSMRICTSLLTARWSRSVRCETLDCSCASAQPAGQQLLTYCQHCCSTLPPAGACQPAVLYYMPACVLSLWPCCSCCCAGSSCTVMTRSLASSRSDAAADAAACSASSLRDIERRVQSVHGRDLHVVPWTQT